MNLQQYTAELKTRIMLKFKNVLEHEVDKGIKDNESFIKFCFDNEFTVDHVVHELAI